MLLPTQFASILFLGVSTYVNAIPLDKEENLLSVRVPQHSESGTVTDCGILPHNVELGKVGTVHIWQRLDLYMPTVKNLTPKKGPHKGQENWHDKYRKNVENLGGSHLEILMGDVKTIEHEKTPILGDLTLTGLEFDTSEGSWVDKFQDGKGAPTESYSDVYEPTRAGEKCWYEGHTEPGHGIDTIKEIIEEGKKYQEGKTYEIGVVDCTTFVAHILAALKLTTK